MPLLHYRPKDMAVLRLSLEDIDGNIVVEFGTGATLSGVRTVADLRALSTWPGGLRLLVDSRTALVCEGRAALAPLARSGTF